MWLSVQRNSSIKYSIAIEQVFKTATRIAGNIDLKADFIEQRQENYMNLQNTKNTKQKE